MTFQMQQAELTPPVLWYVFPVDNKGENTYVRVYK